jgi:putative ABC transport system ATP-binding protein
MGEILKVQNVEKYYGNKGNLTKALDKVSFDVCEGESPA